MQLYKWCPLLTRTMSPLTVGLIWCFLIGVSSISHPSQNSSSHPIPGLIVKLKNNATHHSSFAKKHAFHRTNLFTEAPRTSVRVSVSSRPITNNGSRKDIERIPKLHLNSRLKVRNASEENSTIIYLPRLSRSMSNFSKNSVKHELQPIIVSKHRRILLDPKEYKVRRASDTRNLPKINASTQFGSKLKHKIVQNSTNTNAKKFGLRFSESPKYVKTTPRPNNRRVFKPDESNYQLLSESAVLVNIKRSKNNTRTKNSSILQFLPTNSSRHEYNKIFPRIYRRRGRNFDISDLNVKETSFDELITLPAPNETDYTRRSENGTDLRQKFLTSSQLLSAIKNSSFEQDLPSSSENSEEKTFPDFGYSYAEKKAKNLTIYEILKPRLKSNNTNSDEIIEFSPDQNSFSLQNDAVYHQINDFEENESSANNIVDREESNNNTLVTNEIDEGISNYEKNSMVITPGRSDSSYGIEYVTVNRSNVSFIPKANDTGLHKDIESGNGKDNHSSTTLTDTEDLNTNIKADEIHKREGDMNTLLEKVFLHRQDEDDSNERIYYIENSNATARYNNTAENLSADGSEYMTLLYESDKVRRPKMTENINNDNTPFKNPRMDSKMFYDYFAKRPVGNATLRDFPYLEYRPGNMFRYSDIYQRQPILDVVYTRPTRILTTKTDTHVVTEETMTNPTTFNSLRTSVRVLSTFYPNRMQDVTMKFGNRIEATTHPSSFSNDKKPQYRNEEDPDDAEYRDSIDPGFTMEKLAYLLIGTCCGLSILCLFVVVVAIKCRRAIVEKRLKAQFRKRMYHHERMKDMASPWQQQMFDHFMYLHRRPADSSCSSNTDSCNCRCVTWSLGARNLDATRPLCPTSRNSLYLYGQKKLPFGAASTLRFESMLGRKRSSPENTQQKMESHNTDSSHENDSLDLDSDSREGDGPKQCTCIDYNVWPIQPNNVPRGFFTLCPNPGRYNTGNCSQHPPVDFRTLARDLPPPVTGSNYLDRSEGVVYWSSNEERLI